jgi:hypothetical protein
MAGLLLLTSTPALGQTPSDARASAPDVAALRAEVDELRGEVGALRALVAEMRAALAAGHPAPPRTGSAPAQQQPAPVVSPEQFEIVRAQLGELAQTKVESASRQPVKLSGTILANTFVNSGDANWIENPNLVDAPSLASGSTGSMSGTMRQSRLGLEMTGVAVGSWQATGAIVADFLGGVPNFQTGTVMGLPRMVYAFARLQRDGTAIQVGQDHVLLAPRDPTSLAALSFPLLFRSGNLYLRAPQVRVEQALGDRWHAAIGLVAPIAGDAGNDFEFAPPAGTGERSKLPGLQARIAVGRDDRDAPREASIGFSGHVSGRRVGEFDDASWAVAVDFRARSGRAGVTGEWFVAENVEAFGGAVSQPGRAAGGWIEGQFAVTPTTSVNGGFGLDRPSDAVGRLVRAENRSAYGNLTMSFTPEVAVSAEYRWLRTRLGFQPVPRQNHHVNLVLALRF